MLSRIPYLERGTTIARKKTAQAPLRNMKRKKKHKTIREGNSKLHNTVQLFEILPYSCQWLLEFTRGERRIMYARLMMG